MKCDHPNCKCPSTTFERNGKRYCSPRCADLAAGGSKPEETCSCGHPDCAR